MFNIRHSIHANVFKKFRLKYMDRRMQPKLGSDEVMAYIMNHGWIGEDFFTAMWTIDVYFIINPLTK